MIWVTRTRGNLTLPKGTSLPAETHAGEKPSYENEILVGTNAGETLVPKRTTKLKQGQREPTIPTKGRSQRVQTFPEGSEL